MTQRLYKTASITTAGGSVTTNMFFFEPVPMGSVWTGTVEVITAPPGAFHTAMISGIVWAQWSGFGPSPVLQAIAGEVIEIDSIGLLSNTVYQASIIGRWDDDSSYEPVWPLNTGILLTGPATIQPQTVTTIGTGGTTFGPFNVGSFIGMRFSAAVENGLSDALFDLRWYDTQALAVANATNPNTYDAAGIFDFHVMAPPDNVNRPKSFIIPHQADWLVVTVSAAVAGNTTVHWSMANRQEGFDIFGEGYATGAQNFDVAIGAFGTICTPPANGPWYRIKSITARCNGTPAAGTLSTFALSDDGIASKSWLGIGQPPATANPIIIDKAVDVTIQNPTRLCFQNGTGVDVRVGATWEVVPPMFNFPRDT